jgi:hypothetical protein
MDLIAGICARSLLIAAFLAVSKALQIQSSLGDESDTVCLAEGVQRSEEFRTALTLSLLTGGMVVVNAERGTVSI